MRSPRSVFSTVGALPLSATGRDELHPMAVTAIEAIAILNAVRVRMMNGSCSEISR
jgi:hypothetical protein